MSYVIYTGPMSVTEVEAQNARKARRNALVLSLLLIYFLAGFFVAPVSIRVTSQDEAIRAGIASPQHQVKFDMALAADSRLTPTDVVRGDYNPGIPTPIPGLTWQEPVTTIASFVMPRELPRTAGECATPEDTDALAAGFDPCE